MNPSFARLPCGKAEAMSRFGQWLGLPEKEAPVVLDQTQAFERATALEEWRGIAFFLFERAGWTVFEDWTGCLSARTAAQWQSLAGAGALVFAGYNDAVPYAQIVVIEAGQIVREFLDDRQEPSKNINRGRLRRERAHPIETWVEAASYIDEDPAADSAARGTLWLLSPPAG